MVQNKQNVSIALKKASSLIAKVSKMVEENKYCIDIIQQNLAVIGLLKSANNTLLEGHLNHCFRNAVQSKDKKRQDEMTEELVKVMKLADRK